MKHRASLVLFILPPMMGLIAISVLLFSAEGGRATQAPKVGLDMVPVGNSYDAGSNSMTVGTIDNCLATDAPGNNDRHNAQSANQHRRLAGTVHGPAAFDQS